MVSSLPRKLSNEKEGRERKCYSFSVQGSKRNCDGRSFSAVSWLGNACESSNWLENIERGEKKGVKANIFTVQKGRLDLLSSVKGCGFGLQLPRMTFPG